MMNTNKLYALFDLTLDYKLREFEKKSYTKPEAYLKFKKIWYEYLERFSPYVIVLRENEKDTVLEQLFNLINQGNFNKILINNPYNKEEILLIHKEFAEKVLVLGELPIG